MRARLAILLTLVAMVAVGTPVLVAAVNNPTEGLGVAEFNGVQSVSILVAPNRASINLAVFTTGLAASTNHTVEVFRNDTCGAVGLSLTGPIGPVATNGLGHLNVLATPSLGALIDQLGTQDIAVRIVDNTGATVRCANVFVNNPGGAGRHWW
jgi:hypothetical protein